MPAHFDPSKTSFEEACSRAPFAPLIQLTLTLADSVGRWRRARAVTAKPLRGEADGTPTPVVPT
jgi:hypothetical protein